MDLIHELTGVWRGEGTGSYPDIPPFRYIEETTLTMAAEWSMLHVLQKTWLSDRGGKGKALHLEAGILLARDDGSLLYSCGQDSGRTEVMAGTPVRTATGGIHIAWATTAHANDPRLVKLGREWSFDGERFEYRAYLATVRTPEYRQHLNARLTRVPH